MILVLITTTVNYAEKVIMMLTYILQITVMQCKDIPYNRHYVVIIECHNRLRELETLNPCTSTQMQFGACEVNA